MARILICPENEPGHLTPSFGLARALCDRGHEVIYGTIPDMQSFVEERGFLTVALQPGIFPRGYVANLLRFVGNDYLRAIDWDMARCKFDLHAGAGARQLTAVEADLVLCDIFRPELALTAHRLGIPLCMINVVMCIRPDPHWPPLTSSVSPDEGWLMTQTLRWQQSFVGTMPTTCRFWARELAAELAYCGYDSRQVCLDSAIGPLLTQYPEINLSPRSLDFPRTLPSGVTHFVSRVEPARLQATSQELEAFVDPDKTFVYASLGSQAFRYPHGLTFLKAVIEAVGSRQDWQAVLAVGSRLFSQRPFERVPDNVRVVPFAPQAGLLRRAQLFVTHGGINGFQEGIETQTPMLVIPQGYDQPGNAIRVVYHGAGLMLPAALANGDSVRCCLEQLLGDHASYTARLTRLREQVHAESSNNDLAIAWIEEALRARRTPGPRRPSESCPAPPTSMFGWLFVDPDGLPEGVPSLEPGTEVRDPGQEVPAVGKRGFTVARSLLAALLRGRGPWLVRARVSGDLSIDPPDVAGRVLRVLWCADASEVLQDLKWWRVREALEQARLRKPELTGLIRDLREGITRVRSHPEAVDSAETRDTLRNLALEYADQGCRVLATLERDVPILAQTTLIVTDILTECLVEWSRNGASRPASGLGQCDRRTDSPLERAEMTLGRLVLSLAIGRFGMDVVDEELAAYDHATDPA